MGKASSVARVVGVNLSVGQPAALTLLHMDLNEIFVFVEEL